MEKKDQVDFSSDSGGSVAFILIVAASFASWLVNAGNLDLANPGLPLAIGLGVFYCLVGTVGFAWADRSMNRRHWWIVLYFLVQFALGFGASGLLKGSNSITILLIPLAWQSVLVRSRSVLLWVNVGLCVGIVLLYGFVRPDWLDALRMSATLFAGIIAAMLFGQMAVREQDSRAEVGRLAADLQRKNEALRAHAATAEAAAIAAERNRLAREIHDSLGHYLTASAMQVQSARVMLSNSGLETDVPDVVDALRKAEGLAQEALADVRKSVHALRETSISQEALPKALQKLIQDMKVGNQIPVRFELIGAPYTLPPQAELSFYRVAQEGLTNVHKHAHATAATMRLHYGPDYVRLELQDNGSGILPEAVGADVASESVMENSGFGLIGLRERLGLLGGTVETVSPPEGGFILRAEVYR